MLSVMRRSMHSTTSELDAASATFNILSASAFRHAKRINDTHTRRAHDALNAAEELLAGLRQAQSDGRLTATWSSYVRDAAERSILTVDALRKRGDVFLAHEEAGCPPVLVYDY